MSKSPTTEAPTTKTAMVKVLGCKVNQAEAAAMERILREAGYAVDPASDSPDMIVVHTCCVTQKAEGKARRLVKQLSDKHPTAKFILTGCLAQVNPDALDRIPNPHLVIGTADRDRFAALIDAGGWGTGVGRRVPSSHARTCTDLGVGILAGRGRAFLKIQDGCSQRCTYCIVPQARGPARSLPLPNVMANALALEHSGCAEIVLTGVHIGAYGSDLADGVRLENLVEALLHACPSVRLRLSSVEPQEITPGLIDLVADHPRVCKHLHMPVQSADDTILHRMGRPYDATSVHELLGTVRRRIPDLCVGMDIMVGFPGEDDRAFEKTREFIERSCAAYAHVFPFSARPGTPAASFVPRIPRGEAVRRVESLRTLSAELRKRFYLRFLGRVLDAVVESSPSESGRTVNARTDNYILVTCDKPSLDHLDASVRVVPERVEDGRVWGRLHADTGQGLRCSGAG
ncbi:MAG: MiaB/RimO family radical SAM methylthiotransferase [Thermodesulfobacteriota bacterium]